jgi:hypothetical protein
MQTRSKDINVADDALNIIRECHQVHELHNEQQTKLQNVHMALIQRILLAFSCCDNQNYQLFDI